MDFKSSLLSSVKNLLIALIIAFSIRSFLFEPFHIPSGSMKPNLLIGDYLFVSKYSYGYSRYSFPFGIKFFEGRIFEKSPPKRGDIAVFRLPTDPSVNYIKRIIGLPGDTIQVLDGVVYLNDQPIEKTASGSFHDEDNQLEIKEFTEQLPTKDGRRQAITVLDQVPDSVKDNTDVYAVPAGHYFMMGDNRDNSQDSRFQSEVGYVPEENLVGKAQMIFFSVSQPIWEVWNWPSSIRLNRFFHKID